MKHSDLKVGMKVKRVKCISTGGYNAVSGNPVTVSYIAPDYFNVYEDIPEDPIDGDWLAEYFEPVEEIKEEAMTNNITMDKKYRTRCGYPARVICVDMKKNDWPVVCVVEYPDGSEVMNNVTINGKERDNEEDDLDLIEVSPWEDFKKDDKVMVSKDGKTWEKRHFSRVECGMPCCYYSGFSSWTGGDAGTDAWPYCRKPTQEELEG